MWDSFHYNTLEELKQAAATVGEDLPLSENISLLNQPLQIWQHTLPNRLAIQPMEGCDGEVDGSPGELTFRRYRRFAESGGALIWEEATAIVPEGRANPRQLMLTEKNLDSFRRLTNEIREYTHTLSSRISLKQRNNRCETLLEKQLEPILVYAQTKGIAFPAGFRKTAWKHLLQNHPHDSICGCSCDTVHQDMQYRFSQAEMLAKGLLTEIWDKLVGKRHIIEAEGGFINLFNPSPTKRQEGIEITLPFKPNFPKYKEPFGYEEINRFRIFTQQGEEIYYTIKKMETNKVFLLYGETWEKVDYYTIVLETELQPFGFTALKLLPDDRPVRFFGEGLYHNGRLENKYLSVDINSDGTINLFDKSTNRRYEKLLELWDDTEIGDGWNSVRPKVASVITSGTLKGIEVLTNSPYFAEICLHREYVIPQNILHTNSSFERNTTAVSLPIDIKLSISSNSQSVNVCMNIENKACDHRLRLILPTGCIGNNYQVNQSFTFLNRTVPCMFTAPAMIPAEKTGSAPEKWE